MSARAAHFIRGTIAVILVLCLISSYGNGREYKSITDWVLDSQTFRMLFKIASLVLAGYLAWGRFRTQKNGIN
jgi:hypothetical protein